jgi:pilus assembly protein Flp/PilA
MLMSNDALLKFLKNQNDGDFQMIDAINKFLKDENGATAIEYGLIAALVAVAIVGALTTLGGGLTTMFGNVNSDL